jgi:hypothetical protein
MWLLPPPVLAEEPAQPSDLLNAELWMQTAIEYRADCLTVYALAKTRLEEALADKNRTAYDQTGDYQSLLPAVILDLDETALDNSQYEASLVVNGTTSIQRPGTGGPRSHRQKPYRVPSSSPNMPVPLYCKQLSCAADV